MSIAKRHYELPTVLIKPNGGLTGHEFLMRELPTRLYIRIRAREVDDQELLRETLAAIVDHSLDVEPQELHPLQILALSDAWRETWEEQALPPVTGRPSRRRSPSPP